MAGAEQTRRNSLGRLHGGLDNSSGGGSRRGSEVPIPTSEGVLSLVPPTVIPVPKYQRKVERRKKEK